MVSPTRTQRSICKNCRKAYGSHYGEDCQLHGSETVFEPVVSGRSRVAKARQHTSYQVDLIGELWQPGFKGTHTMTFDHLPTDTEIRQKAGDFQDVTDYQTVAITRTEHSDGMGYSERTKVIDSWRDNESADLFVNG